MTYCAFWSTMVSLGEWQPIGLPNNQPCAYESSLLPFFRALQLRHAAATAGGTSSQGPSARKESSEGGSPSFFLHPPPPCFTIIHIFFPWKKQRSGGANLDVRKLFLPRNSPRQMRSTFRIRITRIKSKVSDLSFVSKPIWNWRIPLLDRVSGPLNERRSGVPSELYIYRSLYTV